MSRENIKCFDFNQYSTIINMKFYLVFFILIFKLKRTQNLTTIRHTQKFLKITFSNPKSKNMQYIFYPTTNNNSSYYYV